METNQTKTIENSQTILVNVHAVHSENGYLYELTAGKIIALCAYSS